jgi:predicted DNA-binding protein (UPF0251 family)
MPRPKRIRKVFNPPHFKGFRPIGLPEENNPVVLNFEEYEAIRLSDFELHGQVEASRIMDVSRPTYARIYESARRKIAQAFISGRAIVFEGGKVYFDSDWYSCNHCGCWFNHPAKDQKVAKCALCGSVQFEQYNENNQNHSKGDCCICPKCGFEKLHSAGVPCNREICPECNCAMMRKGAPHHYRHGNKNC